MSRSSPAESKAFALESFVRALAGLEDGPVGEVPPHIAACAQVTLNMADAAYLLAEERQSGEAAPLAPSLCNMLAVLAELLEDPQVFYGAYGMDLYDPHGAPLDVAIGEWWRDGRPAPPEVTAMVAERAAAAAAAKAKAKAERDALLRRERKEAAESWDREGPAMETVIPENWREISGDDLLAAVRAAAPDEPTGSQADFKHSCGTVTTLTEFDFNRGHYVCPGCRETVQLGQAFNLGGDNG